MVAVFLMLDELHNTSVQFNLTLSTSKTDFVVIIFCVPTLFVGYVFLVYIKEYAHKLTNAIYRFFALYCVFYALFGSKSFTFLYLFQSL